MSSVVGVEAVVSIPDVEVGIVVLIATDAELEKSSVVSSAIEC